VSGIHQLNLARVKYDLDWPRLIKVNRITTRLDLEDRARYLRPSLYLYFEFNFIGVNKWRIITSITTSSSAVAKSTIS